jgi:hypothetical protein
MATASSHEVQIVVPPPRDPSELVEQARRFVVLLGPNDGSLPTPANEVNYLIPISCDRSIGTSGRLETISLRWALERSGDRLVDTKTPVGFNRLVSLCWLDDDDALHQLAVGRIPEQRHTINAKNERVNIVARFDDDMIGAEKIKGHNQWNAVYESVFVDQDLVFNPRVKGIIRGNCSDIESANPDDPHAEVYHWLDCEATIETHGVTAKPWTLATAVHSLCWLCNGSETYVLNPVLADLETALADEGHIKADRMLRNVLIQRGTSLREALNMLLKPLRFGWRLQHSDTPGEKSTLVFFALRDGIEQELSIARPGELITRSNTKVSDYQATFDVASMANVVEGFSSAIEIENSWELWPAWHPDLDDDPDYSPERIMAYDQTEGSKSRDVWLKFVANESGEYSDLGREGMPDPQDFADLLTDAGGARTSAIRRRRFWPMLTQSLLGKEPSPIMDKGFILEVRDEHDLLDGEGWVAVDWDFEVLANECGIRLRRPHSEVKYVIENAVGGIAPLRLTATVRTDFAQWGVADRREQSPNGTEIKSVLDLSSKFHRKRVLETSRNYDTHHEAITSVGDFSIQVSAVIDEIVTPGETVVVLDSTGNDGTYQITQINRTASTTEVIVAERLPSTVADGVLAFRTEEAADGTRLQQYVERIRDTDDVCELSLSVTVDRFEPGLVIGNVIKKIDGRSLDLNLSTDPQEPVFPTIVGVTYSLSGEQKTEVKTETFRGTNFDNGAA